MRIRGVKYNYNNTLRIRGFRYTFCNNDYRYIFKFYKNIERQYRYFPYYYLRYYTICG